MEIKIKIDLSKIYVDYNIQSKEQIWARTLKYMVKASKDILDEISNQVPSPQLKEKYNKFIKTMEKEVDRVMDETDKSLRVGKYEKDFVDETKEIIDKLSSPDKGANIADILFEAKQRGLRHKEVKDAIDMLKEYGEIYEPEKDNYKITGHYGG